MTLSSDAAGDDVVWIDEQSAEQLLRRLKDDGWEIAPLDGGTSSDTFFAAARALPADPPMGPYPNWDGFADSLSGGIVVLDQVSLAIVWRDAGLMREADPQVLATAVDVFRQVVGNVRDERRAGRSSARVRVYVLDAADK